VPSAFELLSLLEADSISWSVVGRFFSLPLALRFARPLEFPWLELVPLA
jgi:hypothetical protein